MNYKITGWALALAGQAIIALGFFYFFDFIGLLGKESCWLNFIGLSVLYWIWLANIYAHPIRLDDESGKQAAGLGIKWGALMLFTVAVLCIFVVTLLLALSGSPLPTKWQVLAYVIVWFLLAISFFTSGVVTQFAGKVYKDQEIQKAGKVDLKYAFADLMEQIEGTPGLPAEIKERVGALSEDTRYITPSRSADATRADAKVMEDIKALSLSLSDYQLNKERVAQLLPTLERHFKQRRESY